MAATKSESRREREEGNGGGGGGEGGGNDAGGELQSSPNVRTALVDGVTFTNKAVQYAEIDGMAMFEGDIVLGTAEEVRQETEERQRFITEAGDAGPVLQSVGITAGVGSQFRWPGGLIPYEIDPNLPNKQRVTDAIAHWKAKTSIKFVLRTAANQAQHPDYVRFVPGGGCSSQVGRRGGQQVITLGPGCTTGNTIHEIGHTVGLWHEQSREDRDNFVKIIWPNIQAGFSHNFNQHISDGDDLGAYDYGSIMHYPRNAFSSNGQDTIIPVQGGAQIGQRTGLSPGDIAGVKMMYPPPKLKFIDDPLKLKFRDDIITKSKALDDIKLKFVDDPIKRKSFDDVKLPGLDRGKLPGSDLGRPDLGRPPVFGQGGLQPFVLATPHHAAVGGQGSGQLDAQMAQAQAYLQQLEAQLAQLQAMAEETQQEYARVAAEYQQVAEALGLAGQGR